MFSVLCNRLSWVLGVAALMLALLNGCAGTGQIHASVDYRSISLAPGNLETHGLAFITPSTITGREEDTQGLAFIFARALEQQRPKIPVVSLPETLSAINQAGMADAYKQMYVDYRDTGIFKRESLSGVGTITGVRYLAQLKLSSFNQNSRGRFNLLGLRLLQTKEANVRLFLQIWNSEQGTIVWEGTEELNYAWDTLREKPVTFQHAVSEIARNLIGKLPGSGGAAVARPASSPE